MGCLETRVEDELEVERDVYLFGFLCKLSTYHGSFFGVRDLMRKGKK